MSKVSNKNVEGGYPYNNASCIHKVKCVYEGNDKSRQGEMIRELECFTAIKWSCIQSGTLQYPELIRLHWIVAAHNVTAWPLLSRMSRADITHHITTSHLHSNNPAAILFPSLRRSLVTATGVNHRSIEPFVFFRTIGNGWVKIPSLHRYQDNTSQQKMQHNTGHLVWSRCRSYYTSFVLEKWGQNLNEYCNFRYLNMHLNFYTSAIVSL